MDRIRLINNVPQTRQTSRSQPTPAWIVVIIVIIVALDICILADLLTGRDSCTLDKCPAPEAGSQWSDQQDQAQLHSDGCFRAAVFENNRIDLDDYGQSIESNLAVYDKVAKIASKNGANMIVFPEDGIVMGIRRKIEPHLQLVPDPELLDEQSNNPCLHANKFETSEILRNLSCLARENKLYVIANFGTRQDCDPNEQVGDRKCPEKGFFALNTDVVLDPAGNFIKRYRKYNLFVEIFDHPPALEEVFFDTPFGRFGVFTCFDILFKKPAIDLVEKHQVDTVLFPTWWYDEAPILSATLSQDAWSLGNRVNLLAANVFRPGLGSIGSGIYSQNNTVHTTASSKNAKLLIANLAANPKSGQCMKNFDPLTVEIVTGHPVDEYKKKNYELQASDRIFTLEQLEARKTICSGQVCCTVDYKINAESIQPDSLSRMVLIARDNNRLGTFNFYEQVCLLASLEKPLNLSAGKPLNETVYSHEPLVSFERLSLKGTFETRNVFPFAGHQITQPIKRNDRHFECYELGKLIKCEHAYLVEANPRLKEKKVYSFGMYGRVYDRDIMPEGWN